MRASMASSILGAFLVTSLALSPLSRAEARAVCVDPRCGYVDIEPPLPPDVAPPIRVPTLRLRDVAPRLRGLATHVDECFATHFEGARAPRNHPVTVFVHPDGRWSVAFGPRPRVPARGQELRGTSPLEVCIADWIAGELGPSIQPPGGRAIRRVAVTFHPQLPPPVVEAIVR